MTFFQAAGEFFFNAGGAARVVGGEADEGPGMKDAQDRDEYLMAGLADGRPESLERLIRRHAGGLLTFLRRMVGDAHRSEELFQEVFLSVWRNRRSYQFPRPFKPWLYAIARNTCLSALRAQSYRNTANLSDVAEPATTVNSTAPTVDWERMLARLPEAQRDAITLFYFEERSVAEVAALLGVPEGTVKSQLHRARRALADMLE